MADLIDSLWARLRIPPKEIKRRMKVAARIRPRRQLVGPPLATAAATGRRSAWSPGRSVRIICG